MDIVINIQPIVDFLALPPDVMLLRGLLLFGWLPILLLMMWGFKEVWVNNIIQEIWGSQQSFTLLAIDIPRANNQSPRFVEDTFNYLAGAHGSINLIEKYWEGKFQLGFSLEIVSIEGYTQFLIRTPVANRYLVESAIYSHYPDAEISEVADYTLDTPSKFPDEDYDVWGAEFILAKNQLFPIKTYPDFEHDSGKPEEKFKDPMAALMDLCSSLRKGEQFWYQIIINPTDFDWTKEADAQVAKVIGEKVASKPNIVDKIVDLFFSLIDMLTSLAPSEAKKEEKKEDQFKLMNLKPHQKKQMEAIYRKASKIGFISKVRMVYLGKKEVFNKPKVVQGFVGYIKQFADLDLNNLKPDTDMTATNAAYFFKEKRLWTKQRKIMSNYKARSAYNGRSPYILNTEELATLWHFPNEATVRAPLIQRSPGRRSEPPMELPIGERFVALDASKPSFDQDKEKIFDLSAALNQFDSIPEEPVKPPKNKGEAPPNLPFA